MAWYVGVAQLLRSSQVFNILDIIDFVIKYNFFDKNGKKELQKVLTGKFALTKLIHYGRHFNSQCVNSKTKLNTCAAIEGRSTLVVDHDDQDGHDSDCYHY